MYSTILNTTGIYNDLDITLFTKEATIRTINKGDILLEQGETAKSLYFLISGAIYQQSSSDIQDYISDLHMENEWFLNIESFVSQRPSANQIKAFSQSTVLELSIESIHYLVAKSTSFLQLNSVLTSPEKAHIQSAGLTPLEKYTFITTRRPNVLQAFPLKMIASYLKITPETVSRVRKSMVTPIS